MGDRGPSWWLLISSRSQKDRSLDVIESGSTDFCVEVFLLQYTYVTLLASKYGTGSKSIKSQLPLHVVPVPVPTAATVHVDVISVNKFGLSDTVQATRYASEKEAPNKIWRRID